MLLQPLMYLDVWALSHSLYARRAKMGKPKDGVRRLRVSGDDTDLNDWPILNNMLSRAFRLLDERLGGWQLTAADIEGLEPGAALPWQAGVDGEIEAHLAIVTNPLARLYAGAEVYSPGWGEVVLSTPNRLAKRSASNHGDTARYHLVLRLRRVTTGHEQ